MAIKKQTIPGVNIQWPWSRLLMSGEKTIETRGYPLPEKFKHVTLAVIETPGPHGLKEANIKKARIIGTITFGGSKKYQSKNEWAADFASHRVKGDDPVFSYQAGTPKFGWIVESFTVLEAPIPAPKKKGIVFATRCDVPSVNTKTQPRKG